MYRIRRVLLIVFFLFCIVKIFSNSSIDSLKSEIVLESGEKKLYLLFQLAIWYQDTEEAYNIASNLEKESIAQRNVQYLCAPVKAA